MGRGQREGQEFQGVPRAEVELVLHLSQIKFPFPAPSLWDPPLSQHGHRDRTQQEQSPAPAAVKPPQNNKENPAGKAKSPPLIFIRVGSAICCRPSRPRWAGKAAELRGSRAKPASLDGQAGTTWLPVPPKHRWAQGLHPKTAWDEKKEWDPWSLWGGNPRIHPQIPGIGTGVTPALAGLFWSLLCPRPGVGMMVSPAVLVLLCLCPRIGMGVTPTLAGLSWSLFSQTFRVGMEVTLTLACLSQSLLCPNPSDWHGDGTGPGRAVPVSALPKSLGLAQG